MWTWQLFLFRFRVNRCRVESSLRVLVVGRRDEKIRFGGEYNTQRKSATVVRTRLLGYLRII